MLSEIETRRSTAAVVEHNPIKNHLCLSQIRTVSTGDVIH